MYVTVFRDKYAKGLKGVTDLFFPDKIEKGDFVPIELALNTMFASDAHFVAYYLGHRYTAEPYMYCRVNKTFMCKDFQVFCTGRVYDVDMPKHTSLKYSWATDIVEKIFTVTEAQFVYLTKNGLRFIEPYQSPIPFFNHEIGMQKYIKKYKEQGIPCDWLFDYTRYFRLPFVIRDGKQTTSEIITKSNYKPICNLWRELHTEEKVIDSRIKEVTSNEYIRK